MTGARVELRGISHAYGPKPVLDRVDLTVAPGEFVALLGASGSGKSTLLRLIAALEAADDGEVRLSSAEGAPVVVRVMFQEDRLLPWKRVLENVQLGTRGRRAEAQQLLAAVGLADRARSWPSDLSGGQRQRVAIARALLQRPDLLLLDEPFGALDAITRVEMQCLLEALWEEDRPTVILVTHDVEEALVLADRVLVLGDGAVRHEVEVPLTRPRHRGDAFIATHKEELLDELVPQITRVG